ncbi:MAG: PKD domain-containing protein [Planctomycetota bacterium]
MDRMYILTVRFIAVFALLLFSPDITIAANQLPTASPTATPPNGPYPLRILFQANAEDPDGDRLTYRWDFGDPSSPDNTSTEENPTHIYQEKGIYQATVVVSDGYDSKTFSRTVRGGLYLVDFIFGDFDLNGRVNAKDLRMLASAWLSINGDDDYNSNADLDHGDTVDLEDLAEFATDWGPSNVALIIGISDYNWLTDLNYADNDASDWYNYLDNLWKFVWCSNIIVLGDHTSSYPDYHGLATEHRIKQKLSSIVNLLDSNDELIIIFSGIGGGDGFGNSYFSAWDSPAGVDGEDGDLWDYELAAILNNTPAKVFVFFDVDKSGGMIDDLAGMTSASGVYATGSCQDNGNKIELHDVGNGAWTYYFLEDGLVDHFGSSPATTMEDCFIWADSNYNPGGDDEPVEFDGNTGEDFTLW